MIVGAALTIGGAWIVDRQNIGNPGGTFVNWERVESGWGNLRDATRNQLRRLTG